MMVWHVLKISTDHKQNEYERSSFQYLKLNLSIKSETNPKTMNVLDVKLNLNTENHEPCNKPNNNS